MDFVEDFGTQVNKYIGEPFFCIGALDHSLTFNQCLSYFKSFRLLGWFK